MGEITLIERNVPNGEGFDRKFPQIVHPEGGEMKKHS